MIIKGYLTPIEWDLHHQKNQYFASSIVHCIEQIHYCLTKKQFQYKPKSDRQYEKNLNYLVVILATQKLSICLDQPLFAIFHHNYCHTKPDLKYFPKQYCPN